MRLDLLHGSREAQAGDLFASVTRVADLGPEPASLRDRAAQLRFILGAMRWLGRNAARTDAVYLPSVNKMTLAAALAAERRGLAACLRVAGLRAELHDKSGLQRALGGERLRARLIGAASLTFAISRAIERRLLAMRVPPARVAYLPQPVDTGRFRPASAAERARARARFGIPGAARVVLCVGKIGVRKGQHLLAEALARLPEDVHLLLVGPEEAPGWRPAGEGLAARLHHVAYMNDVEEAYRAADLFALPSLDEGMSNALLEAMASGLPLIGTRISGTEDMIGEEARGLYAERTPAALAGAIARLLHSPEALGRLSALCRDHAAAHHGQEVVGDRLIARLAALRDGRRHA